jgi:hypothetical protein
MQGRQLFISSPERKALQYAIMKIAEVELGIFLKVVGPSTVLAFASFPEPCAERSCHK